ncbi:hypothetical protein KAX08_02410 [candidate division WOR-3 bacterium]|nr:hypothetical protein [candidate division WOR-3 bacterium]
MKKYLLLILILLITNCAVAPIMRYSSSIKKDGIGFRIDISYGRRLETGINSDGSIDSLNQD